MRFYRRTVFFAAVAITAAVTALAACSSGSGNSSSSSGSGNSSSSGGKSPITVFVTTTFTGNAPTGTYPYDVTAAEAAASTINASGGVNGRRIVIDSCDDQGNPNTATECAEKAVRDHVSVVTGLFIFGPNTFDVLTPAKIPVISGDPIYPVETTASNAFPISAGSIPGAAGSGWVLPHSGAKRVAVICGNAPANQAICGPAQQGVKAGGGTVIRVVTAQDGSPDYSPYVAEALSGGNVQGLVYAGTNTDLTKLFLAVQQANFKGRIGLAIATLPSLDLKTLGPEANQLLLVSQYVVPVSAATKAFTDSMAKYAKTAPINLVSEAEWASVEAAAKAMMGHPGSSAAAMMEALSSQTALNVGAYLPVLDMTKPGPLAGSPRLFSPDLVQYEVSDYKLVQVGTFFDPYAP